MSKLIGPLIWICNANTRLLKSTQVGWLVGWRVATGSFKIHLLGPRMDQFKAVTLLRIFRWQEPAFILCCGSTPLPLPPAKLPWPALANLSHLQIQWTPLSLLQPSPNPSDVEGWNQNSWGNCLPILPSWGRGQWTCVGWGSARGCATALAALGARQREARRKPKKVVFNCHLNMCLISSFARKHLPSHPYFHKGRGSWRSTDGTSLLGRHDKHLAQGALLAPSQCSFGFADLV